MTTMTPTSKTIKSAYNCYRATLRSLNSHDGQLERVGARKQEALRIASKRYHIPMGALKTIIREMDEAKGIKHDHPESYLLHLTYLDKVAALEANSDGVCPNCHGNNDRYELDEKDNVLRVRANPYEYEVNGILSPMLSCFKCYLIVASDI